MAVKGLIKDSNNVEIMPITRGELVLDSSGNKALHSNEFLATNSLPGLMSPADKQKLVNLHIDDVLNVESENPVQNKVITNVVNNVKKLAEDAQTAADDVAADLSDTILQVNTIKESYLKSASVENDKLSIKDQSDTEISFINTTYDVVSRDFPGLSPAIGSTVSETIKTQASEWVLTSTRGASPTWRKLPSNAFKNDDNNTLYTLSGEIFDNSFITSLTPSSGSVTKAIIPTMTPATENASGNVGLVPAPSSTDTLKYLRGDGQWANPEDTRVTQTITSASADYPLLLAPSGQTDTTTTTSYFASEVTLNPRTNTINANITGAAGSVSWTNIDGKPDVYEPSEHSHPSFQINVLNGYETATEVLDLLNGDSLNTALGKLEYKSDLGVSAYNIINAAYDGDGTIENLNEILKVLEGIKDTDTIQAIVGKYLPLAGGIIDGTVVIAPESNNDPLVLKSRSLFNKISFYNSASYVGGLGFIGLNTPTFMSQTNNIYPLLHSGNFNNYAPTLEGEGATGTWNIDISGSASKLSGLSISTDPNGKNFNTIPVIKEDGVIELGRYLDLHYDNTNSYDYSTRIETSGNHQNIITLPEQSGTLALTSQIPSVGDGTITINQNGTLKGTFTTNQADGITVNLENTYTIPLFTSGLQISTQIEGIDSYDLYVPYAQRNVPGVINGNTQYFLGDKHFEYINGIRPGDLLFAVGSIYGSNDYDWYDTFDSNFVIGTYLENSNKINVIIHNNSSRDCVIYPTLIPIYADASAMAYQVVPYAYIYQGNVSTPHGLEMVAGSHVSFHIIFGVGFINYSASLGGSRSGFICNIFAKYKE